MRNNYLSEWFWGENWHIGHSQSASEDNKAAKQNLPHTVPMPRRCFFVVVNWDKTGKSKAEENCGDNEAIDDLIINYVVIFLLPLIWKLYQNIIRLFDWQSEAEIAGPKKSITDPRTQNEWFFQTLNMLAFSPSLWTAARAQ